MPQLPKLDFKRKGQYVELILNGWPLPWPVASYHMAEATGSGCYTITLIVTMDTQKDFTCTCDTSKDK